MSTTTANHRRYAWDYFAQLRRNGNESQLESETEPPSNIEVSTPAPEPEIDTLSPLPSFAQPRSLITAYNETLRLGHMDITVALSERANGFTMVSASVAAALALHHLNERTNIDGIITLPPQLQGRDSCDLYFTYTALDNTVNNKIATEKIMRRSVAGNAPHSLRDPRPMAIVGSLMSYLTDLQSIVSGILDIPQVGVATSSSLVRTNTTRPTWARTTASNYQDAHAAAVYFHSIGVRHVNCLYIEDVYGRTYAADFVEAAAEFNITVATAVFWGEESMLRDDSPYQALRQLQQTGYRHFFGIFLMQNMEQVMVAANQLGLVGDEYAWVLCEGLSSFVTGSYQPSSPQIAALFQGLAVLFLDVPSNPTFDSMLAETATDPSFQEHFLSTVDDPLVLQDFDFTSITTNMYIYTMYDAAMALGIAACQMSERFFTGPQLYQQLLQSDFVGVSGRVRFDPETGSRKAEDLTFNLYNINLLLVNETDGITIQQDIRKTAHITGNKITTIAPFYYYDGTINIPPELAPVKEDLQLIGPGVIRLGYSLGGIIVLGSLFLIFWVVRNQGKPSVAAAQPFFLTMLCIGTAIMGTSIFLLGLQDPIDEEILDRSCMAIPWLVSIGFVTAYTSLYTKLRRLHELVLSASHFRRLTIKPKDTLRPFCILMGLNIAILIAWTVISPIPWERTYTDTKDEYGRLTQSQGQCSLTNSSSIWFVVVIMTIDTLAVLLAAYQAYLARDHPRECKEGHYITLSIAGLSEAILLSIPIFVAAEQNEVVFLVLAALIFVASLALLLPLIRLLSEVKEDIPPPSTWSSISPRDLGITSSGFGVVPTRRNADFSLQAEHHSHNEVVSMESSMFTRDNVRRGAKRNEPLRSGHEVVASHDDNSNEHSSITAELDIFDAGENDVEKCPANSN
jgi:hypothetical protein